MSNKKILHIDMDQVIVDFEKGMKLIAPDLFIGEGEDYDTRSKFVDEAIAKHPTFFEDLEPIDGAIEAVKQLMYEYEVYFLSTPMENVPHSFTGKKIWLNKHFGALAKKKLILTHRKDLVIGNYLIDDRTRNGAGEFTGEHIHFGTEKFPDWNHVLDYLMPKLGTIQYKLDGVNYKQPISIYNSKENNGFFIIKFLNKVKHRDFFNVCDDNILFTITTIDTIKLNINGFISSIHIDVDDNITQVTLKVNSKKHCN